MKSFKLEKTEELMEETLNIENEIESLEEKWVKPLGTEKKIQVLKMILKSKMDLMKELKCV